jgi:pyrimidine operon attenuation protein/uracil phosphoribosyltransferase
MPENKILIINHEQAIKSISRMAWEIYERNLEENELIIAGIVGRGYAVAELLMAELSKISKQKLSLHQLVIDKRNPQVETISIVPDIKVKGKTTIVVDDVLNSGRTLIYCLVPLITHNAKKIQTAVLIDRSHKTFPVHVDYVGTALSTGVREHVDVTIEQKKVQVYLT